MNTTLRQSVFRFNWPWVGLSFCFFVVYHLLPTFIIGMYDISRASELTSSQFEPATFITQALFLVMICGYLGYRSRGKSSLEPILALAIYLIFFTTFIPLKYPFKGFIYLGPEFMLISAMFVASAISTYLGSVVKMRKEV